MHPLGHLAPDQNLFPDLIARRELDNDLTLILDAVATCVRRGRVAPEPGRQDAGNQLAAFDFAAPMELQDIAAWVIRQLSTGIVQITNPRYFGLFNPAPAFPAVVADRIASFFNPQLASATTSPAAVAIEAHTIRAVARRAGFSADRISGHFTNGGSEANYTALLAALTSSNHAYATHGARAYSGSPKIYVSVDSHLAWIKIVHQAGIGRSAVRFIDTDGHGRLDPVHLAATIEQDRRNGDIPVMVVATAGTTIAGEVDPLGACAEIAWHERLWYHVDAAWGGAAIASDRLRHLLKGVELADSATFDAHKWFATTMGCGMFICARPEILNTVFGVEAAFMPPSRSEGVDPYLSTVQWSRRFLGLRLFMALAAAGWEGYGHHVEKAAGLAATLKDQLEGRGWTVVNDPALAVVCAVPPAGSPSPRAIVQHVVAGGRVWVSSGRFENQDVIRACVTHGESSPDDIRTLVDTLQAALHEVLPDQTARA